MIIVYFLKEDDLNKKVYKFFCRVFCKCKRQNNFSTIQKIKYKAKILTAIQKAK